MPKGISSAGKTDLTAVQHVAPPFIPENGPDRRICNCIKCVDNGKMVDMIEFNASDDGLKDAVRSTMDVYEAVTSRRAVRGFTDRHVPKEVLERVLSAAAWSPSGSNLQPWHTYVLTGAPLAELKKLAGERVAAGDPWDEREYEMYPPALKSPYRERRYAFAEQRYGALGIAREDIEARQRAAIANWDCFGAPAALFCYIDRDMGPAQWADVGMYLQTVMLLLRAEGLHSCPQMAWSTVRKTVAEVLSPPDGLILFCGMSIGYEDVTVEDARTGRAPLDETVTVVEG